MIATSGAFPPVDSPFPSVPLRNALQQHVEIPRPRLSPPPPSQSAAIEVGCGAGIALLALSNHLQPTRLAGVDIDPDRIHEARARSSVAGLDVDLTLSDVRNLPYPDGAIDLVVDFGTCYHIPHPEQALA
ncbi:MAG: class I SAM-dependent methyltransferase [Actinomycetia bacterium]|nr:class I SAM-dependent methyltransferase [Actinomycetes bacterium]